MKNILAILLLTFVALSYQTTYHVHFEADVKGLNYHLEGSGYVSPPEVPLDEMVGAIEADYTGTLKDPEGKVYPTTGHVKVEDPAIFNLDDIKVNGDYEKGKYHGKFSVSIWDVYKNVVPFEGELNLPDAKKGGVEGEVTYLSNLRPAL